MKHYSKGGAIESYIDAHKQAQGFVREKQARDAENAKHLNKEKIMGNPAPSGEYDQNPKYSPEKSRPFDGGTLDRGVPGDLNRDGSKQSRPYKLHDI